MLRSCTISLRYGVTGIPTTRQTKHCWVTAFPATQWEKNAVGVQHFFFLETLLGWGIFLGVDPWFWGSYPHTGWTTVFHHWNCGWTTACWGQPQLGSQQNHSWATVFSPHYETQLTVVPTWNHSWTTAFRSLKTTALMKFRRNVVGRLQF